MYKKCTKSKRLIFPQGRLLIIRYMHMVEAAGVEPGFVSLYTTSY